MADSAETDQALGGTPQERLKEVVRRVIRALEHRRRFLSLVIVLETSDDEDALTIFRQVGTQHRWLFDEVKGVQ